MRIGIITFPGSLDDVDAARAVRLAGAEPVALWHADHDLRDVEAVVLPGGFSYGDYLRAGAIAARAPMMADVVDRARQGMPVLGICNGFQVLCEAGLLPGALTRNAHLHFRNRDQAPDVDVGHPGEAEGGQRALYRLALRIEDPGLGADEHAHAGQGAVRSTQAEKGSPASVS